MAKAYWVVCYRSIADPEAREKYTKLAVPAVLAAGGRFLTRGIAAQAYEHGVKERTVVVEFESLAKQSLYTMDRSTKRHSPFWGIGLSATCGLSKASTSDGVARRR